jgi:hypothetical protein
VVERVIGNDEVGSSILPSSTIFLHILVTSRASMANVGLWHRARGETDMTDNNRNEPESRGKAWLPLTGTGLALVILALVAVLGAGTVMMMMG